MQLASAAIHVINIRDYADMICDLALKRQLIGVGEGVVNTAYSQDIDAPASTQIEQAEQQLFNIAMDGGSDQGFRALRSSVAEAVERAQNAYKNDGKIVGVDTGLRDLNEILGGLQDSDLLILAGRPSMGKTALATNLAFNAAEFFQAQAKTTGEPVKSGWLLLTGKCRANNWQCACLHRPAASHRTSLPTVISPMTNSKRSCASLPKWASCLCILMTRQPLPFPPYEPAHAA